MIYKTLIKKRLREFRAKKEAIGLSVLFAFSLLGLARFWSDEPWAILLGIVPLLPMGFYLAPACAIVTFRYDFAKGANRFWEYLPISRSAIWLVNYLSGLVVLCLSTIALFWLQVLLYRTGPGSELFRHELGPSAFEHLAPNRLSLTASLAGILFWLFSVGVFPVAYLDKQEQKPSGTPALAAVCCLLLSIVVCVTLNLCHVVPAGLSLAAVLIVSGILFSAGSYVLFALAPRHITPGKRALLGLGLFLAISGVLVGHLYLKHLEWRKLDPSEPALVERLYRLSRLPIKDNPDLVLANVRSYRSGMHSVLIDMKRGVHHDLGRWMTFVDVPNNHDGLLYFVKSSHPDDDRSRQSFFVLVGTDGTARHSFAIPHSSRSYANEVRYLPGKKLLAYKAVFPEDRLSRSYLCVANSNGTLLKRFEIGYGDCLVNEAGQALALAPAETANESDDDETESTKYKPYMLIDLDTGSVERFGLPGEALLFARDLRRVICSRQRIEDGRRYQSYVLVELPSLRERQILSETEFPPETITSQVWEMFYPSIATNNEESLKEFLCVDASFRKALYLKKRIDGDYFRFSIHLIDFETTERTTIVPEDALPQMAVVDTGRDADRSVAIRQFTADLAGFIYQIGPKAWLCDIESGESTIICDTSIMVQGVEESEGIGSAPGSVDYSPSGRRALRYDNAWERSTLDRDRPSRFKSAAVDVFVDGKPVRVYTGKRRPVGAEWLDEDRILIFEADKMCVLDAAGGEPRQVFPPATGATP
ncbi:MAG TPA: hypothetical protein DD670_16870 [Planctomycetaceae bacterium]|nr:hypothetical protein [Planctomycetaceae bacterium]